MSVEERIKKLGGEGILTEEDLADFSDAKRRIYQLMLDGEWHGGYEIKVTASSTGRPMPSGLRRMRELRKVPGIEIERRRSDKGRHFEYKLTHTRVE